MTKRLQPDNKQEAKKELFHVLFVDDDESQRKMFQRATKGFYSTYIAENMDDAISILDLHKSSIGVIVSDVRMPNGDGLALLEHCHTHFPDMIRILLSAYAESSPKQVLHAVNKLDIHRYLQKPVGITEIREEISIALDLFFKKKAEMLFIDQENIISSFKKSCEKWLIYISSINESVKCLDYGLQAIFNEYKRNIDHILSLDTQKDLYKKLEDELDDFMESDVVSAFTDDNGKYLKQGTKH